MPVINGYNKMLEYVVAQYTVRTGFFNPRPQFRLHALADISDFALTGHDHYHVFKNDRPDRQLRQIESLDIRNFGGTCYLRFACPIFFEPIKS